MKKKIIAFALCVAMLAIAVIGGSLAYFTDEDAATNTFVSGNVEIEQYEKDRNGKDFEQGQKLFPIVDDKKDDNGYHLGGNYIDKIITVKNTGSEDAYIRTHIAFPAALDDGPTTYDASKNIFHWNGASANDTFGAANWGGTIENDWYWGKSVEVDWPGNAGDWNFYQVYFGEELYNVYVVTHGSVVAPDEITAPNLLGVYLDSMVDYDNKNEKYVLVTVDKEGNKVEVPINFDLNKEVKIYAVSEAVQADGFEVYEDQENVAFYALDKAFGEIGTYCPFTGGSLKEPQA